MPIQFQEFLIGPGSAEEGVKCALFAQIISRCGNAKFKALGTSMLPSIWPGDTLIVQREDATGLVAGDVAVYLRFNRLFAHRVVRLVNEPVVSLVTRGDAMESDDPPVLAHEIVGRVARIVPGPRLAHRMRRTLAVLRNAMAVFFLAGAVLLLLLQA